MYRKEIIYLGLYKDGDRLGNAGFLKVEKRDRDGNLSLTVKNVPHSINGKYPVRYYSGSDWKETDGITVQEGCGQWTRQETDSLEQVRLQIILPGGYSVEGADRAAEEKNKLEQPELSVIAAPEQKLPEPPVIAAPEQKSSEPPVIAAPEQKLPEPPVIAAPEQRIPEPKPLMADALAIEGLKEDKWEQILDTYDNIHPYADGRVYVKISPKDFIILSGKYQHLVNNSFLLHGFYNYRHVILGKEGGSYVLGVPGVFYEREKMVALMFGFEAFECESGEPKAGGFGYYLRQVEL